MRLLARLYADGPMPSKVSIETTACMPNLIADGSAVVAEFYEAQVYGQVSIESQNTNLKARDVFRTYSLSRLSKIFLSSLIPIGFEISDLRSHKASMEEV